MQKKKKSASLSFLLLVLPLLEKLNLPLFHSSLPPPLRSHDSDPRETQKVANAYSPTRRGGPPARAATAGVREEDHDAADGEESEGVVKVGRYVVLWNIIIIAAAAGLLGA